MTAATSISVAAAATLSAAVVIVVAAHKTARLPDLIEKWLRRRPWRWLGIKAGHRGWTHYLTTTILCGLAVGGLAFGVLYGAAVGLVELGASESAEGIRILLQAAVGMGVLCAIGGICGCSSHSLSDACTEGGVPLLGPFVKRDLFLMPEKLRVAVGQKVYNPDGTVKRDEDGRIVKLWKPTRQERCWQLGAWVVTVVLVALWQFPDELQAFVRALAQELGF